MNFEHIEVPVPEDCDFKISPSSIEKFFSFPTIWYRDNFLGENSFTGNAGSVTGDIVHALAESAAKGEGSDRQAIEDYITGIEDLEIDKIQIRENYPDMAHTLINEYVMRNIPDETEQSGHLKILDGVYVAGTWDGYYQDGTILDYKTASKKPNTDSIPFKYLIQALAYAKMLKAQGREANRIRIVYVVQKTKTLPVRVFVVDHIITQENWEMIDNTLMLMAETIRLQRSHPEYIHLLYKSMKLKT